MLDFSNCFICFTDSKPSKTQKIVSSENTARFTVTASRFHPDPSPSSSFKKHQAKPTVVVPHTALAIEDLFTIPPNSKEKNHKIKPKRPTSPQALRKELNQGSFNEQDLQDLEPIQKDRLAYIKKIQHDREKTQDTVEKTHEKYDRPFRRRPTSSTSKSRPDVILFGKDRRRFKPKIEKPRGGSTLVPIIIEGTGKVAGTQTHILESSFSTPPEVVVTASQGFASLKVIEQSSTAVQNKIDYLEAQPLFEVEEDYELYDIEPTATLQDLLNESDLPTGLVTTLGGTIISDGLTTVHETNVIGTFIGSKYAQILQSTSRIFQVTPVPSDNLNSPSLGYETVKSIIEGSATQFITPDSASSLPLESLFSAPTGRSRNARLEDSKLTKRRGPEFRRPEHFQYRDPYLDDGDDYDLIRSGTDLRPSFRPIASIASRRHYASGIAPTTYRPHIKPTSRRGLRPTTYRSDAFKHERTTKPTNRWRLTTSEKPKVNINRNLPPAFLKPSKSQHRNNEEEKEEEITEPTPQLKEVEEETIRVETSYLDNKASDVWHETATIRKLHTFKVGTTKNTRFVTFTKTFTKSIEPTGVLSSKNTLDDALYETPLFENILDEPREVATLPPIDVNEGDVTALLSTVTDTFSTTETMLKTSVLPVVQAGETASYTLTQTYLITRVVTAVKTVPPVEAFSFIPENSLNEFNDKLLAEGTENDAALLPGELEYDENGETRVKPPPGFKLPGPALSELAGGKFNPDALEQQLHPEFAAALKNRNQAAQPSLQSTKQTLPSNPTLPTPGLTPEQLQQLAYIRLMNPYAAAAFGFPGFQQQPQVTVTSSPVVFTTDITTTSTRLLRVIFNARPIITTVTNTEVVHTTTTTYETSTVTLTPQIGSFPGFPFPGVPFGAG